ncbi:MAG: flagellar basal body-associated FliL family protein [Treponema sp.]|jgi:flagellar basal body-associated protein FliL|nr:flagellar basal body-associated FliL family protein [Treponema sp.]
MKSPEKSAPALSLPNLISRVLIVTAAVLALVLLGGTIYALAFRGKGEKAEAAAPAPGENPPVETELDGMFTGIGRIRASTGAPESATVILSIAFPYSPQDKAFSGELASRIGDFRAGVIDYFASFSTEELRQKDEAALKAELLERFNKMLRLGQLTTLYFSDYLIIE